MKYLGLTRVATLYNPLTCEAGLRSSHPKVFLPKYMWPKTRVKSLEIMLCNILTSYHTFIALVSFHQGLKNEMYSSLIALASSRHGLKSLICNTFIALVFKRTSHLAHLSSWFISHQGFMNETYYKFTRVSCLLTPSKISGDITQVRATWLVMRVAGYYLHKIKIHVHCFFTCPGLNFAISISFSTGLISWGPYYIQISKKKLEITSTSIQQRLLNLP